MASNQLQIQQTVLPNGLRILGEPNRFSRSAAMGFFVRTGARDETVKEAGVSHFLEHMMFKGTPKRSAIQLTYDLGNIGAQSNAYTSEESTVYYGAVIPEHAMDLHEILSDMLRPSIDPAEFDMEKKVILEEIALYQDRPQFYLFEHAFGDFFAGHPAGNSVLGSNQSISALSRDEMYAYFERRYSAANMTLVASGNFDWDALVAKTTELSGGWKRIEAGRTVNPFRSKPIQKVYKKKNLTQAHTVLVADGCSAQDSDRTALTLLAMILGDGSGSKLYWELVDTGLADVAGADSDERDGTGTFLAYASTEPAKIDEVSDIVRRVLSKPLDFTDAELSRAKTKLATKVVLGGELPMGRLMSIGTEWLQRQRLHNLSEVASEIKAISRKSIEDALGRHPLSAWSEFRLMPEAE